jgi:hypothetical protein
VDEGPLRRHVIPGHGAHLSLGSIAIATVSSRA